MVGGVLSPWDGAVPPSLEKDVARHLEGLQVLFTQRLEDWARYMAVYGAARQEKWNSRGWMRLIFEAMRANVREGRGRRHGGAMAQGKDAPTGMPYCGD